MIEQAGADALELNLYEVATQLNASSVAIEERIVNIVRDLKGLIKIPIAVKLSPFFTALGNLAAQLDAAGADGLVLFNRFYQPDFDIRTMKAEPQAELSTQRRVAAQTAMDRPPPRKNPPLARIIRRRRGEGGRNQGDSGGG